MGNPFTPGSADWYQYNAGNPYVRAKAAQIEQERAASAPTFSPSAQMAATPPAASATPAPAPAPFKPPTPSMDDVARLRAAGQLEYVSGYNYRLTDPGARARAAAAGWDPDRLDLNWAVYYLNGGTGRPDTAQSPQKPQNSQGETANFEALDRARVLSDMAAYRAYLNERLHQLEIPEMQARTELEREKLAFEKAKQAWQETYYRETLALQQQELKEKARQFDIQQRLKELELLEQQRQANIKAALDTLELGSRLRGPADYGQYLRTLAGTPQGLRDLVASASGLYQHPTIGAGAPGAQVQPATLQSLVSDVTGQHVSQTLASYDQAAAMLPSPTQLAVQNILRMSPTQRDLLFGMYEYKGYRPEDIEHYIKQSLPQLSGPQYGLVKL